MLPELFQCLALSETKAQDESYRNEVLLPNVPKVSIEAGISMGWKDVLGEKCNHVSIEHFGASDSANVLFEKIWLNIENVTKIVKESIIKNIL